MNAVSVGDQSERAQQAQLLGARAQTHEVNAVNVVRKVHVDLEVGHAIRVQILNDNNSDISADLQYGQQQNVKEQPRSE